MRTNLMLAVGLVGVFGLSLPAHADHPTGDRVERGQHARGAQRHRRQVRRERRRQARQARRRAQRQRQRQVQRRRAARRSQVRVAVRAPVIVGVPQPVVVTQMAFDVQQTQQQAVVLTAGSMPAPYSMPGYVVGQIPSAQLGLPQGCPGYWAQQPQHVISLPGGMPYFRVDVLSGADTTLAVVTPDGQVWCNDDGGEGRNPRLEGQFPPGTYAVYVGTYQPGRRASYTAQLSERAAIVVAQGPTVTVQQAYPPRAYPPQAYPPQAYPGQVVYAQAPAAPPSCREILLERGHHPSLLTHCEGAEPYCAAALLRAGHHPANLVHCEDVPPRCAVTLLEQGHHPANLVHCEDAEPACAEQVLRSGQHPANLVHCQ